jgi:hypothetical protein
MMRHDSQLMGEQRGLNSGNLLLGPEGEHWDKMSELWLVTRLEQQWEQRKEMWRDVK